MSLPPELANVLQRPKMYLPAVSYDAVVAYVLGYDAATRGGLLIGFREWLIVKLQDGNNLGWPELLLELRKRGGTRKGAPQNAEPGTVEFLHASLEGFVSERDTRGGLQRIYAAYQAWLRQQEWYTPSSPDWVPPG